MIFKPLYHSTALLCLLAISLMFSGTLTAQSPVSAQPSPQDSSKKLKIETAFQVEYFVRGDRTIQKLSGNVRMRQEDVLVFCDTAILDEFDAILKGNVVIQQHDTVKVFADSAHYRTDTKISDLYKDVVLENGRQKLFTQRLRYDLGQKIATYHTGATMSNGKSQLVSKHGYYYVDDGDMYFKGNVVVTDPEFTMRTDTLAFNSKTQLVRFVAPTLISQPKGKIYTEGGFYDIENNFAEFDLNPQYDREGQVGTAKKMRYSGTLKEYILEGDAFIDDRPKGRKTRAEVIRYNADTEDTYLRGNADYQDSTRNIKGEEIRYNSRDKNYQIKGRGRVNDPPNIIEADSLSFNDQLGAGVALGRVDWRDTSADVTILAYRMDYNKQSSYLNAFGGYGPQGATGRPLMKSLIERDTLYMSADTLTSFKPDSASDERKLLAHRDVRIYKSDLQAVCDSLSFSSKDSVFWFYQIKKLPIMWSDTSQFSGDTIRMRLKDKKMDRIWLRKNAFVINSEDGQFFNQISGKYITAVFREDQVRDMLVEGNAQAVYYALDDKRAYIGVNETACSEMKLYFGNNKVESIKFYNQPAGTFSPIKKAKTAKKLEGFFWETERRPGGVGDL